MRGYAPASWPFRRWVTKKISRPSIRLAHVTLLSSRPKRVPFKNPHLRNNDNRKEGHMDTHDYCNDNADLYGHYDDGLPKSSSLLTQPGPYHRHVDYEAGVIMHIDPITGEVLRERAMRRPSSEEEKFKAWAKERQEDLVGLFDASRCGAKAKPKDTPNGPQRGRGRPKTVYKNPTAAYMHLLAVPHPLPWVLNIIHGSCVTSAGVVGGMIAVKQCNVLRALFLNEITAEACQTPGMSLRTAQRVAKAARHAAHGIASYVERYPRLQGEIAAELAMLPCAE